MRLDPKPPIYSEKKRSIDAATPSPKRVKTDKESRPLSDRDLDKRRAFMQLEPADKAALKTSLLCLQRVKNPSLPRLVKPLIASQFLPKLSLKAERKVIHAMILRSVHENVKDTVLGMAHFCHQFGLD